MLSLSSSAMAFTAPVAPARPAAAASTVRMETVADLKVLAEKCNPLLGFYDPLNLTRVGSVRVRAAPRQLPATPLAL